ncbi:hypothetical protein NDU88_010826 [Pleurodeles waltl]|uniref:Uncharacterized protein n=1 Tax=Pleurodeles waltl TaxID=8319 RepID=A0AAV7R1B9_PLEWA|nr:hypothetical protein NDU88_010826 [Pleurodeles waltl]
MLQKDFFGDDAKLRDLEKSLPMQPQWVEEWQQTRRALLDDWRRLERHVYRAYHHRLHAEGDKAGVLLASLLKQHSDHKPVTALVDVTVKRVCSQIAI